MYLYFGPGTILNFIIIAVSDHFLHSLCFLEKNRHLERLICLVSSDEYKVEQELRSPNPEYSQVPTGPVPWGPLRVAVI